MEGLDPEYANQLAGWVLKESEQLQHQAPAFREKVYLVADISRKQGAEKFLQHAKEFAKICPDIFQLSEDNSKCRIKAK